MGTLELQTDRELADSQVHSNSHLRLINPIEPRTIF